MPGLKVIIIDSHNSFSMSAKKYLVAQKNIDIVKVVSSCFDINFLINNFAPDLLLIDERFTMAESKVHAVINKLMQQRPGVRVLIMSLYPRIEYVCSKLIDMNFAGVITKQDFASEMQPYLHTLQLKSSGGVNGKQ